MKMRTLLLAMMLLASAQHLMAQVIDIAFNGDKATVNIPEGVTDVVATTNGAYVNIVSATATTEYTYRVSGNTENGGLVINGAYKLTLLLNGVSITSRQGAAIDVQCGKRIAVVVNKGTTNTLADMAGGTHKAALYFSGHPEFEGGGTLNVTGNTKHAISAKEYLQIKKSFGTLNILGAVSDGLHCGKEKVAAWDENMVANEHEFFICGGGNININNVGGDCIDTGMYGCVLMKGGALNLSAKAYDVHAIKSCNTFIMEDGRINIEVSGGASSGIYTNNQARFLGGEVFIDVQGDGSKGIRGKLKPETGYTDGGNILFSGTKTEIIARGGDDETDPLDVSHCVGISVDGNLVCSNAVKVTAVNKALGIVCGGEMTGEPIVETCHWYAHPYDFQYDMIAYFSLELDGKAVSPADAEVAAFVGDECRGVAKAVDGAEGVYSVRIRSNAANGENVAFKAFYKNAEVALVASQPVAFTADGVAGTVNAPIVLKGNGGLLGDVNGDGIVDVNDVVLLVSYVLDNSVVVNKDATDVNADGKTDVNDVVRLISLILK